MKCHWTARSEIAIGAPLVVVGAMLATNRRREGLRNLSILGVSLGALAIITPTYLVGTCTTPTMFCNTAMKPVLIITGGLAIGISVVSLVMSQRKKDILS